MRNLFYYAVRGNDPAAPLLGIDLGTTPYTDGKGQKHPVLDPVIKMAFQTPRGWQLCRPDGSIHFTENHRTDALSRIYEDLHRIAPNIYESNIGGSLVRVTFGKCAETILISQQTDRGPAFAAFIPGEPPRVRLWQDEDDVLDEYDINPHYQRIP